jgi:dTDP-4-amino-4,6-dideoxygalactose transaminase
VIRNGADGMDVVEPGGKFNLSDVHAAVGLGQLARLESITRRRAELASCYFEAARAEGLVELGIELPPQADPDGALTNWHMFQVVLPGERLRGARAAVMQALRDQGIGTGVHYPALHTFSFYRAQGWREGQLPHTERIGRGILTLPLFPTLDADEIPRIVRTLADTCKRLLI